MVVLKSKDDYTAILEKLKKEGNDINGTYELVGKGLRTLPMTTKDIIDIFDLDKGRRRNRSSSLQSAI